MLGRRRHPGRSWPADDASAISMMPSRCRPPIEVKNARHSIRPGGLKQETADGQTDQHCRTAGNSSQQLTSGQVVGSAVQQLSMPTHAIHVCLRLIAKRSLGSAAEPPGAEWAGALSLVQLSLARAVAADRWLPGSQRRSTSAVYLMGPSLGPCRAFEAGAGQGPHAAAAIATARGATCAGSPRATVPGPPRRASAVGLSTVFEWAAGPLLRPETCRLSRALAGASAAGSDLPPLVLIGTAPLMAKSPEVALPDISTSEFQDKLEELKQCMIEYGGIGIAGPQVGWYERIFCLGLFKQSERYPELNPQTLPFQYWINPTVTPDPEAGWSWFWEGCLSVPGLRGWVQRPDAIDVSGYNEDGELTTVKLRGITARVFQHEFDHLDGILFPARVDHPSHLVPVASFEDQDGWAENWPTPEARHCLPGDLYHPQQSGTQQ